MNVICLLKIIYLVGLYTSQTMYLIESWVFHQCFQNSAKVQDRHIGLSTNFNEMT